MPEARDKELYDKIKKEIVNKYKPSAYRSGLIVKNYKEEYYKKHNNNDSYTGNRLQSKFDEKWTNQNKKLDFKKKEMYIDQQLKLIIKLQLHSMN